MEQIFELLSELMTDYETEPVNIRIEYERGTEE